MPSFEDKIRRLASSQPDSQASEIPDLDPTMFMSRAGQRELAAAQGQTGSDIFDLSPEIEHTERVIRRAFNVQDPAEVYQADLQALWSENLPPHLREAAQEVPAVQGNDVVFDMDFDSGGDFSGPHPTTGPMTARSVYANDGQVVGSLQSGRFQPMPRPAAPADSRVQAQTTYASRNPVPVTEVQPYSEKSSWDHILDDD